VSPEIVDYVAGIHVYNCEIQCCCNLSSDVFVLAMGPPEIPRPATFAAYMLEAM
jgi:hypothetical protein